MFVLPALDRMFCLRVPFHPIAFPFQHQGGTQDTLSFGLGVGHVSE